jgi:hypothetical protein
MKRFDSRFNWRFNWRSRKALVVLSLLFFLGLGIVAARPLLSLLARNVQAPVAVQSTSPQTSSGQPNAAQPNPKQEEGIDRFEAANAKGKPAQPAPNFLSQVLSNLPLARPQPTPTPETTPRITAGTPGNMPGAVPGAVPGAAVMGGVQAGAGQPVTAQAGASAGVVPPIGADASKTESLTPSVAAMQPAQLAGVYQPSYEVAWAHPSNFGLRLSRDIFNRPMRNQPIIVLHETVAPGDSVVSYFQTPHANDSEQASYHTMIRRNGTVVYMVPPDKRAYGAGNSVFRGAAGDESVNTHKGYPPSVNNFSYHISLESPPDGYGDGGQHSGYSDVQYRSLAWLVAQSTVPLERVTTHREVDRSGERIDPRSFNRAIFANYLKQLRPSS